MEKNTFTLSFDAQYGKAEEEDGSYITNLSKYFAELEYDYSVTKKFMFDYLTGYKDDKFSTYDYQFYTGPGGKYQAIDTKKHNFSLEGNLLYSYDKYNQEDGVILEDDVNDYASLQAKGVYSWQILDNLKFEESASYRVDLENGDNYFIYSDTELSSKISDIFAAGIGYKIDYVNKPGENKEHTDRTFLVTLSIDY